MEYSEKEYIEKKKHPLYCVQCIYIDLNKTATIHNDKTPNNKSKYKFSV